ncbi:ABC transporter permease subunit [Mumia zhuanghuii]|uniref:ABC transporter permease n=1 Tax=Mumia zhuanghuii TaxID=2585211 RepID=A0A5C4MF53_9ACTN|nr:ABC transporter permease subunit [Mumia zhuanghuii]TNC42449.1 ABC transporter permease [Mumia zhuanghuii]TNC43704.1 ABC transporter permease [Mumia zhuanghuii]
MTTLIDNPVLRSTRAEVLRLRRWPAVWVLVAVWIALGLVFGYLFPYLSYRTGDLSFAGDGDTRAQLLVEMLPAALPTVLVQGLPMFGGALALVLGAIVAGNGYGWGTWKTVFTQGPSRPATVGGSLVALTLAVLGSLALTLVLFLGVSLLVAGTESQAVTWPSAGAMLESFGGGFLVIEMWALLGFALGTVARGPALAVGLGLVWALVVENLLRGVGALLGPVEAVTEVLPGTAGGSLVGALVDVSSNPNETPGVLDVLTGSQALLTVLAYCVGLVVLVLVVVRRRDVT